MGWSIPSIPSIHIYQMASFVFSPSIALCRCVWLQKGEGFLMWIKLLRKQVDLQSSPGGLGCWTWGWKGCPRPPPSSLHPIKPFSPEAKLAFSPSFSHFSFSFLCLFVHTAHQTILPPVHHSPSFLSLSPPNFVLMQGLPPIYPHEAIFALVQPCLTIFLDFLNHCCFSKSTNTHTTDVGSSSVL